MMKCMIKKDFIEECDDMKIFSQCDSENEVVRLKAIDRQDQFNQIDKPNRDTDHMNRISTGCGRARENTCRRHSCRRG